MQRRDLDLRDFDALIADAEHLLAAGYDRLGNWDLGATCRHLSISMHASIDGLNYKPPFHYRFIRPFARRQVFGKRRLPTGAPAPTGLESPTGGDDADAVTELKTAIERLKTATDFPHPHPVFGRITPQQWRDFHLIHGSHHLGFLIPRPQERNGENVRL